MRSYVCPLEEAGELPAEGEAELRYRGQSFELAVPLQDDLAEAFHRAHEARYGYADRDRAIELVAVRTATSARAGVRAPARRALQDHGPGRTGARWRHVLASPGWVGVRDGTSSTLRLTRLSRDRADS